MDPSSEQVVEDFSSLSLMERVRHKKREARQGAYEEASRKFQTSASERDICFQEFMDDGLWKSIVTDANAFAQEAGITALASFLEFGGPNASVKTRSVVVPGLAEKGLSSSRVSTKQKSIDCILLYVEMDSPMPVVEKLLPFLSHKLPKLVAATLLALKEIYRLFGARTVDPKPLLKVLPATFSHADKNVRTEATNITVELYKWLGEGLKSTLLAELKPVQQKELEDAFEKVKGQSPHQERYLRSQALASTSKREEPQDEASDEVDAYDLVEASDVASKLRRDCPEFEEKLASNKWQERKEALDSLYKLANVPRIKEADFGAIINRLGIVISKDSNALVVVPTAASCVEVLAKGLRAAFRQYRSVLVQILERFREKKQSVVDSLAKAADAVTCCSYFSDIAEDLLQFLGHKNPQCKLESIRFLTRCLSSTSIAPDAEDTKRYAETLVTVMGDTSPQVREAAAEAFGTLMKIQGERPMTIYLADLDDIRKKKTKEYFNAASVRAKPTLPKPAPALSSSTNRPAPTGKKVLMKRAPGNNAKDTITKLASSAPSVSNPPSAAASRISRPSATLSTANKLMPPKGLKRPSSPSRYSATDDTSAKPQLIGRGLTGRSLTTTAPSPRTSRPASAAGLSSLEKTELDELRKENAQLNQQFTDSKAEISKLLSDVNDLQLKVSFPGDND